jgi:sulfatase maturation enzyme AslB (radical SAM superfamily)
MYVAILVILTVALAAEAAGTPEAQKADRRTREYKATSARVLNNSAMIHESQDYFVTHIRRPVGNEGIPDQITLGDTVTVKGRSIRVRHIFVTETLEDLKWGGKVLAKKGDVDCMIVESEENLPYVDETRQNKRWIHIAQCEAKP